MQRLLNKIRSLGVVVGLIVIVTMSMSPTGVAFADNTPGASIEVKGGSLTEVVSDITITGTTKVVLRRQNRNLPVNIPITVIDASGSAIGWKVTIKASPFSDGGKYKLHNMPTVSGVTSASVAGSSSANPRNNVSYASFTIPTGTARTLFNAAAGTGMGVFTLTPAMNLKLQTNDAPGTYTSMFTVAIISGPE